MNNHKLIISEVCIFCDGKKCEFCDKYLYEINMYYCEKCKLKFWRYKRYTSGSNFANCLLLDYKNLSCEECILKSIME